MKAPAAGVVSEAGSTHSLLEFHPQRVLSMLTHEAGQQDERGSRPQREPQDVNYPLAVMAGSKVSCSWKRLPVVV